MEHRSSSKSVVPVSLSLAVGGIYLAREGHELIGLLLIIFALIIFSTMFYSAPSLSHIILEKKFGPSEEPNESKSEHFLRLAKWWGLGALTIPAAYTISYLPSNFDGLKFVASVIAIIFGIPCFLKMVASLTKALWYRKEATNNQIN